MISRTKTGKYYLIFKESRKEPLPIQKEEKKKNTLQFSNLYTSACLLKKEGGEINCRERRWLFASY